jgi:hypothetical protein
VTAIERLLRLAVVASVVLAVACGGRGAQTGPDAGGAPGAAAGAGGASGGGGAGAISGAGGAAGAAAGALGGTDAGAADTADARPDAPSDTPSSPPDAHADAAPEAPPVIGCDVGCPGGPCPKRVGDTPVVVASVAAPDHVGAIAAGSGFLYVGSIARDIFTRGELRKVSLATGASSVLAPGVQVSKIVLAPNGTLYFVSNEVQSQAVRLWVLSGAGPPAVKQTNDLPLPAIIPRGVELWLEVPFHGGGVISVEDAGSYSNVAEFDGAPHGLSVDDKNIYWTSGDGPSRLLRLDRNDYYNSAKAMPLASADDLLVGPLIFGGSLYVLHQHAPGECAGSIGVVTTAGGAETLVSLGHSGSDASSFAVDDGHVYWTTPDGGGLVLRAPHGGGTPEVLASGQTGATAVTTDADRVYWIAAGANGDEVRAVAK